LPIEFFSGPLDVITQAIEDSIYSITNITALELVGQAKSRDDEKESVKYLEEWKRGKLEEEKEWDRRRLEAKKENEKEKIDVGLKAENEIIDGLRAFRVKEKNSLIPILIGKLIAVPLALMFAILSVLGGGPPFGWIFGAAIIWFLYDEIKNGEKKRAEKEYPYKSYSEIESTLNLESENCKKNRDEEHPDKTPIEVKPPPDTETRIARVESRQRARRAYEAKVANSPYMVCSYEDLCEFLLAKNLICPSIKTVKSLSLEIYGVKSEWRRTLVDRILDNSLDPLVRQDSFLKMICSASNETEITISLGKLPIEEWCSFSHSIPK
jgi:hypothetical protein